MDQIKIGKFLLNCRKEKDLTQEQLAEKLDVSVAFLSRAERGSVKINLTRITQLCDLLDVAISDILTGTASSAKDYLTEDFANLLKDCPPEKIKLIYDIAKVIVKE